MCNYFVFYCGLLNYLFVMLKKVVCLCLKLNGFFFMNHGCCLIVDVRLQWLFPRCS